MASRFTRSGRALPQQQEQQSRAKWTTFLTAILADLMVDQVNKGNKTNKSFGKKAWRDICDDFHKKTGLNWDREQLKNRYAVLKRQYITVKSLLDHSDFSWDELTGNFVATDKAWARYIQEHPDAEPLKSMGCPVYKRLCTIFSEAATNGMRQSVDHEVVTLTSCHSSEPLGPVKEETTSESEEMDDDTGNGLEKVQPIRSVTVSNRKRGRKGIDDAIAGAILEMAAASKLNATAVEQINSRYTIAECIKELDEIQGVTEKVYFAALDLFNNPNAREIFLSLKRDKRLTWLCVKSANLSR